MPIMHVHACAQARHWESFGTVFNHLIGPINGFCWLTWGLSVFVLRDLEIDT